MVHAGGAANLCTKQEAPKNACPKYPFGDVFVTKTTTTKVRCATGPKNVGTIQSHAGGPDPLPIFLRNCGQSGFIGQKNARSKNKRHAHGLSMGLVLVLVLRMLMLLATRTSPSALMVTGCADDPNTTSVTTEKPALPADHATESSKSTLMTSCQHQNAGVDVTTSTSLVASKSRVSVSISVAEHLAAVSVSDECEP